MKWCDHTQYSIDYVIAYRIKVTKWWRMLLISPSVAQLCDVVPHRADPVPPFQPGINMSIVYKKKILSLILHHFMSVLSCISLPFLQEELSSNTDLVQSHRERISKASNLVNIELFWKTYNRWTHPQTSLHGHIYPPANCNQRNLLPFASSRRDLNIDRNSTFK